MPRAFYLFSLVTSGIKIDIPILLKKVSYQILSKKSTECLKEMFQRRKLLFYQGSTSLKP